jgi:hypothetical protein
MCPDGICNVNLLTEDEKRLKGSGFTILTGILQTADQKNGNGRIYPKRVLEREVEIYQKSIREARSVGECDHSDDSVINLKNVSHMILRTWWDGSNVVGTVKILKTPSGQIVQGLLDSGVQLGISSRGLGSVRETREATLVEDDFSLICWDIVSDASNPGSFLYLKEGKQNFKNVYSKEDRIYRLLNKITEKK